MQSRIYIYHCSRNNKYIDNDSVIRYMYRLRQRVSWKSETDILCPTMESVLKCFHNRSICLMKVYKKFAIIKVKNTMSRNVICPQRKESGVKTFVYVVIHQINLKQFENLYNKSFLIIKKGSEGYLNIGNSNM